MITDINSEDRLVQRTFAEHLEKVLGWESVYAHNAETFGPQGTLGRTSERDAVLLRDLRAALARLNPALPESAREQAVEKLTRIDFTRSLTQHNRECYGFIRGGVPVEGFDDNLTDYLSEHSIAHAFNHNAFLVVSNGDQARYGSITSKWEHFVEWKRNTENDKARLDAQALLDGMLAKDRLLDLVENFILFDDSRAGGMRKIVARNHQVLGVNNAVDSVMRQEELKRRIPPGERLIEYRVPMPELRRAAEPVDPVKPPATADSGVDDEELPLLKRADPDLGRLGVFWHTQGSGKSYSMAFFAEKVRRVVPGNFTFLVMTDREDLDDQICRTFVGCGVTDEQTPRAGSGKEFAEILRGNHRFVFSLIAAGLDAEQRRAAEEGLNDDELALFDLLFRENISKADRERLKQASRDLLSSLKALIGPMPGWSQNATTQAQVEVFILDNLYQSLPRPPFTDEETEAAARRIYDQVWQRSAAGDNFAIA